MPGIKKDSVSHGTVIIDSVSPGMGVTSIVEFSQPFAHSPNVVVTVALGMGIASEAVNVACHAYAITAENFSLRVYNATNKTLGPIPVSWIAVG